MACVRVRMKGPVSFGLDHQCNITLECFHRHIAATFVATLASHCKVLDTIAAIVLTLDDVFYG